MSEREYFALSVARVAPNEFLSIIFVFNRNRPICHRSSSSICALKKRFTTTSTTLDFDFILLFAEAGSGYSHCNTVTC